MATPADLRRRQRQRTVRRLLKGRRQVARGARALTASYDGLNLSYMARPRTPLSGTLTIRLPLKSLRVLRARAREERKTTSDLARELLEHDFPASEKSAWDLTRRHVGAVNAGPIVGGARARELLKQWNPDRRE